MNTLVDANTSIGVARHVSEVVHYKPATDDQYDVFWQLLQREAADYMVRTLELMQMSSEEFLQLFRTVGQVYGIYCEDVLAGFYWIEERTPIAHLHGLILERVYQGRGIGTQVLMMLADGYKGVMDAIELGVHASNVGARRLYARLGYQIVKSLPDLDFCIMQLPLAPPESSIFS